MRENDGIDGFGDLDYKTCVGMPSRHITGRLAFYILVWREIEVVNWRWTYLVAPIAHILPVDEESVIWRCLETLVATPRHVLDSYFLYGRALD